MLYNPKLPKNRNDGRGAWAVRWLMRRYEGRTPWNFCWRIALEQTLISIAVVLFMIAFLAAMEALIGVQAPAIGDDYPTGIEDIVLEALLLLVLAPIFETLELQALPIFIARKLKAGLGVQVLVSGALFAATHFLLNEDPIASGLAAGVPGGLYLGFAYAYWCRKSHWTAMWVTAVSHALANVIPAMAAVAEAL